MDFIKIAMDRLHLDACFDMFKCWYILNVLGWAEVKSFGENLPKNGIQQKRFLPLLKKL